MILSCFFGTDMKEERIEGFKIVPYIQNLFADALIQSLSLFYAVFGLKGVKLGLREVDKRMNRRIELYKAWGKSKVDEKI